MKQKNGRNFENSQRNDKNKGIENIQEIYIYIMNFKLFLDDISIGNFY